MCLFSKRKKQNKTDFMMQCLGELAQIRNTASTGDLIGLQYIELDEYMEWRQLHLSSDPREYFRKKIKGMR